MQADDTVVCVFDRPDDVHDAVRALREAGFADRQIGLARPDQTGAADDAIEADADASARTTAETEGRRPIQAMLAAATLSPEAAGWFDDQIRGGATLVTVQAPGRADEARRLLLRAGGRDFEARSEGVTYRDG